MSTDDFDERLSATGARWRAANASAASVSFEQLPDAVAPCDVPITLTPDARAGRPRRRMRVTLGAVSGIAAAVAATLIAVQLNRSPSVQHDAGAGFGAGGVRLVCQATHSVPATQLGADAAVVRQRLQHEGVHGATVTVQGADSLAITAPNSSLASLSGVCAPARLDFRPVVAPAVTVAKGGTRSVDPLHALKFAIPLTDTAYGRLSADQQGQLQAALTHLDCSSDTIRTNPPASYVAACDKPGQLAYLFGPAIVSGTAVAGAEAVGPSGVAGVSWTVQVHLTPAAQLVWGRYTGAHNTGGRPPATPGGPVTCGASGTPCADFVGFVLDGVALSVPVTESVINGADTQVAGNFTEAAAKELAGQLSSGGPLTVPFPVTIITPTR